MERARNFPGCVRFGIAMIVALAPLTAAAADKPAEPPPTAAEFARLQHEVAEQRQLIIQMMQVDQQRYDMLLRLLQSGGQVPSTTALPPPVALPGATAPSATP